MLLLATVHLAHGAPQERCPSRSAADLDRAIQDVSERFQTRELANLDTAGGELEAALRCLDSPVTAEQAARWHAAQALLATSRLDADAALDELRAAGQRTPPGELPAPLTGVPLLASELERVRSEALVSAPVRLRQGEHLLVDGVSQEALPLELPAVLQLQRDELLQTRLWTGDEDPRRWRASFRPEAGPGRWALAGGAGALALGAGAALTVGWINMRHYDDEETPRQELPMLYRRSHALTWVASGAGVGAIGLGAAAVWVW